MLRVKSYITTTPYEHSGEYHHFCKVIIPSCGISQYLSNQLQIKNARIAITYKVGINCYKTGIKWRLRRLCYGLTLSDSWKRNCNLGFCIPKHCCIYIHLLGTISPLHSRSWSCNNTLSKPIHILVLHMLSKIEKLQENPVN